MVSAEHERRAKRGARGEGRAVASKGSWLEGWIGLRVAGSREARLEVQGECINAMATWACVDEGGDRGRGTSDSCELEALLTLRTLLPPYARPELQSSRFAYTLTWPPSASVILGRNWTGDGPNCRQRRAGGMEHQDEGGGGGGRAGMGESVWTTWGV